MESPVLTVLFVQLILITFNAIFSCVEIAVVTMNDNKLDMMAGNGDKRAIKLKHLTNRPARFLATIQVAITFSGFLASAFAAENFSGRLVSWLIAIGVRIPAATLNNISVIFITLILSYITLVFGELVPKRIAMHKAEAIALGLSGFTTFFSKVFAPIVWLLTLSTNAVLRLIGIDPNAEDNTVSEEEIRMLVDVGSEKGTIDLEEKQFIQNVFKFDDITAGEIATHRTDMDLLWLDESDENWKKTIHDSRHSIYPICDETADNIIGVLYVKDYFRLIDRNRESIMLNAVRPAYFVPESVKADVLFRNMRQTRNRFAVVLDDYGGVSGIITINDLLEQLVGQFDDEDNGSESLQSIEHIDTKTWEIQGNIMLQDLSEALNMSLPTEEYDTLSGLVFGTLGTIPDDGAEFDIETAGLNIHVTEIKEHRIEKATVVQL